MLDSPTDVVRCLVTYTDWWQPATSSVLQVGPQRRAVIMQDGLRPGLLESLDERAELCRRLEFLDDRDRLLLYLWYVRQEPVERVARSVGISRRHFFRRRARAIRSLIDLGREAA